MRGNSNTQTYPTLQKRTQSDFYDKKEVLKLSVFLFFLNGKRGLKIYQLVVKTLSGEL